MRSASVSASAGATRAQKPQASAMVFISASDSPTPIQRAVFRASCIASFQPPPAADPLRLRLLDEPKLLLDCQQPVEDLGAGHGRHRNRAAIALVKGFHSSFY